MKKIGMVLLVVIALQSCQIREEISFNKDGSGTYEMAFDMSEMMQMRESFDSLPPKPPIDTLINFASFLDEKKDSISKLSREDREQLATLRPLQFSMKVNDSAKRMDMHLIYKFKKLEDISKFGDALEKANIRELQAMTDPIPGMAAESPNDSVRKNDGIGELFSISESFQTSFSSKKFTRTVTDKAVAEALKKKDTTMKADDPFADMMRLKQVYRFPYRVKRVNNANARILSDFKGVEIEANMYELNNDPRFFNILVEFEK
jgi:hypothetical protein